ncbi:hypothetical protein CEXT_280051 [Caerostris extrusa]|uniref:Uncharacterized protein n=1 Tax=Caerostris extrusa TaxID=172846 RepID=A0AAV4XZC7_CAEEX|nr:hypothetical protein CEXT_280051 [Caerostris extrusa]
MADIFSQFIFTGRRQIYGILKTSSIKANDRCLQHFSILEFERFEVIFCEYQRNMVGSVFVPSHLRIRVRNRRCPEINLWIGMVNPQTLLSKKRRPGTRLGMAKCGYKSMCAIKIPNFNQL